VADLFNIIVIIFYIYSTFLWLWKDFSFTYTSWTSFSSTEHVWL